jgi:hypothetical protein
VATPIPACLREDVVQTAQDPASFAARIDEALLLTAAERQDLRNHARTASWERRVAPLLDRLESLGLRSLD